MTHKELVSPGQMSVLLISMMVGSSIVYIPNPTIEAGRNTAWLSLMISGGCGALVLACLLYMYRQYPQLTLLQYFQAALGKWAMYLFSLFFIPSLFMMNSLIVQGTGAFFTTTMMVETPGYVFHIFLLLAAALTVQAGIEVMARMFALLQFLVFITVFLILVLAVPLYHPTALLPFLPQLKTTLHGAYITWGFPFSEIALFAMLVCFTRPNNGNKLNKYMYSAVAVTFLIFFTVIICTIMVFGKAAGERVFSLYELARLIEVPNIIERFESIVSITLILGTYMKMSIILLMINISLMQILKLKDSRMLTMPVALILFFLSVTMFPTEYDFVHQWSVVWPVMTTLTYVVPLFLSALIVFVKKALA